MDEYLCNITLTHHGRIPARPLFFNIDNMTTTRDIFQMYERTLAISSAEFEFLDLYVGPGKIWFNNVPMRLADIVEYGMSPRLFRHIAKFENAMVIYVQMKIHMLTHKMEPCIVFRHHIYTYSIHVELRQSKYSIDKYFYAALAVS